MPDGAGRFRGGGRHRETGRHLEARCGSPGGSVLRNGSRRDEPSLFL